jgi:hypothetical protein
MVSNLFHFVEVWVNVCIIGVQKNQEAIAAVGSIFASDEWKYWTVGDGSDSQLLV